MHPLPLNPNFYVAHPTDLDAYVKSVETLALLAPHLKLLLPAHNVPVASPAYLEKLVAAIKEVRAGKVASQMRDGKREYAFAGFSFLMAPGQ